MFSCLFFFIFFECLCFVNFLFRMLEVEKESDQITMEIEDVACSISELENNIGQMDSWLTDAITSLKTRQKGANQKAIKAKIDVLYNDKREKEYDMEKLRQSAKDIMDDERVCDQFAMKESLGEVEVKWHELTEHLVQQVSLEVSNASPAQNSVLPIILWHHKMHYIVFSV